ncbi:MAG: hypothetical protein HYX68_25610 [Planctomycetes bacterium]|jgi:hypothetical protein|nr:hypothetical protein [Planctomycetota bacterium]
MNADKKSKSYPTALPHRAPEATALPEKRKPPQSDDSPEAEPEAPTRSRSGARKVGVLGLLTVLGLLAVGVAWHVRLFAEPAATESPVAAPEKSADGLPVAHPAPAPTKKDGFARAQTKLALLKIADPQSKPAVRPFAKAPAPANDAYLEALGSMAAAHLYQTYVNIGLLADAVESEQLKLDEAEKTLANIVRLMTLVDGQFDQVSKLDLDPNDRKALEKVRAHAQTLRKQTTALRAYWEKGETEQINAFHAARSEAWAGIQEMLGLDEMGKQADASR